MEDYQPLFDEFPQLADLLPWPEGVYRPKRIWERRMYRARKICYFMDLCLQTDQKQPLHDFVVDHFGAFLSENGRYRNQLPRPESNVSAQDWLGSYIRVLRLLLARAN